MKELLRRIRRAIFARRLRRDYLTAQAVQWEARRIPARYRRRWKAELLRKAGMARSV